MPFTRRFLPFHKEIFTFSQGDFRLFGAVLFVMPGSFVVQPILLLLPQSWCDTRGLYLFTRRVQTVSRRPVFDVWSFCLWYSPFCAAWCTWASRTCPRSPTTSSSSPAGQLSACTLRWRTRAGCMHFEVGDKWRLIALSGRGGKKYDKNYVVSCRRRKKL